MVLVFGLWFGWRFMVLGWEGVVVWCNGVVGLADGFFSEGEEKVWG